MRISTEKRFNRPFFALLFLLTFVITASCSGGGGDSPSVSSDTQNPGTDTQIPAPEAQISDAEINSLATGMRSAFDVENTNAVSSALRHAGIVVFSDDMSQPMGAVAVNRAAANAYPGTHMLHAQARGMAIELSAGGGFTGTLLNSLTPPLSLEDGTLVPISQLLAAYIAHGDTYGAKQCRALMPGLDPAKHLDTRFPTITIVFFMKEFVVPLLAAAQDPAAVNMSLAFGSYLKLSPLRASVASDPCGAVSEFLDGLAPSVANAVQDLLDPGRSSGFISFVSSVVGSFVQITTDGIKSLLRHAPFVEPLREVANILGALTDMQSLFSQWTVNITPPGPLHKIPGSPNAGEFTLTMDNGGDGFEWPPAVESCADLFGISLPQLDSADGSTVTWNRVSGFDDLGIMTSPSIGVIAGNKASCSVTSATEGADLHNGGGPVATGPLAVRADVQMPGVEQLVTRIGSLVGSFGEGVANAASAVAPHIGPSAPGVAQVEYHKPGAATIDINDGVIFHAVSCSGLLGPYNGTLTVDGGSGAVAFSFNPTTKVAPVSTSFPIPDATYAMNGTFTLGGSDTAPLVTTSAGIIVTTPFGASSGTFGGTYPVALGSSPECPAQ